MIGRNEPFAPIVALTGFFMTRFRHTALLITMAAASLAAVAQTAPEHALHHPAESTKPAAKATTKGPSTAKASMAAMESNMKAMREMHEKMMAAKTPEERKALMGAHMKAMQDGMDMMKKMDTANGMPGMGDMKGMGGMGGMGMHDMMHKRMEMMTSMMQMMMDRLPASPTP